MSDESEFEIDLSWAIYRIKPQHYTPKSSKTPGDVAQRKAAWEEKQAGIIPGRGYDISREIDFGKLVTEQVPPDVLDKYLEDFFSGREFSFDELLDIFGQVQLPDLSELFLGSWGLETWLTDWEFNIDDYLASFDVNYLLNVLADLNLTLSIGVKGIYDETYFDQSYYDPPELTIDDVKKALWYLRYRLTGRRSHLEKYESNAAKASVELLRRMLQYVDLAEEHVESLPVSALVAEGKVLRAAYVGLAIVGRSKVAYSPEKFDVETGIVPVRSTQDYRERVGMRSTTVMDANVNMARVGFARVAPSRKRLRASQVDVIPREKYEEIRNRLESMRSVISGVDVELPGTRTRALPMRQYAYATAGKRRKRGSHHVAIVGEVQRRVSAILDRYGVIGFERKNYHDFALELLYAKHESTSHPKKNWKRVLPVEALLEKYKFLGCDERILSEIRTFVERWKV